MKDLLLVCIGSFIGGGLRFGVSRLMTLFTATALPLGTFVVNVVGCLLIGLLSGVSASGGWLSPSVRLLLTTGFCGGFTTFSTFMNESATLATDGCALTSLVYMAASLLVGFAAVVVGHWLGRSW